MMEKINQVNRLIYRQLPDSGKKGFVLLAGARQTGKTTMAKAKYPDYRYVNLQAPENREAVRRISSDAWGREMNKTILDEAQKEPSIFEKMKYAFDNGDLQSQVILGSNQVWLLKNTKESLTGRISIYEIWPLMMGEIAGQSLNSAKAELSDCPKSWCLSRIFSNQDFNEIFASVPSVLMGEEEMAARETEDYFLRWGGMPALLLMTDDDRRKWIKDYEYTYLEKDVASLVRLDDYEIFHKFKRLASLQSGQMLNYSELARDANVSVDTARRYIEYLKLSYQIFLLQPYAKKVTSTVVKTPKLYWFDVGLLRHLSGYRGEYGGFIYNNMVVGEILKWMRTTQREEDISFYRTRSGLEIDLLIGTEHGTVGIVIKPREEVVESDAKPLKEFARQLGKNWRGGLVIYQGRSIKKIVDPDIWAVPSKRLLK